MRSLLGEELLENVILLHEFADGLVCHLELALVVCGLGRCHRGPGGWLLECPQASERYVINQFDTVDAPPEEILREEEQAHVKDSHVPVAGEAYGIPACEPWQHFFVKILDDPVRGFLASISVLAVRGAYDLLHGCALKFLEILVHDTSVQNWGTLGDVLNYIANIYELSIAVALLPTVLQSFEQILEAA